MYRSFGKRTGLPKLRQNRKFILAIHCDQINIFRPKSTMLELLKKVAMDKLAEKMGPNSLGANETQAAASEGASELVSTLMQQVTSGNLSQITSLFSNDGTSTEGNPITQGIVGKLGEILQNKGMSAQEAQTEAQNTAPAILDSIKDKFLSKDDADKDFDLGNIAGLLGGNAGSILGKLGKMF